MRQRIDEFGIARSNRLAMELAVETLGADLDFALDRRD